MFMQISDWPSLRLAGMLEIRINLRKDIIGLYKQHVVNYRLI